jgi:hypothetical protein
MPAVLCGWRCFFGDEGNDKVIPGGKDDVGAGGVEITKEAGLLRWGKGEPPLAMDRGILNEDVVIRHQRLDGNYDPQGAYLREAMLLRIYSIPY